MFFEQLGTWWNQYGLSALAIIAVLNLIAINGKLVLIFNRFGGLRDDLSMRFMSDLTDNVLQINQRLEGLEFLQNELEECKSALNDLADPLRVQKAEQAYADAGLCYWTEGPGRNELYPKSTPK